MKRSLLVAATLAIAGALGACGSDEPDPTSTTEAPVSCPDQKLGFTRVATGVEAIGVDCAEVEGLIRAARGPCKRPDFKAPCEAAGFGCTLTGEPSANQIPIVCVDGGRQVSWTWSGGY